MESLLKHIAQLESQLAEIQRQTTAAQQQMVRIKDVANRMTLSWAEVRFPPELSDVLMHIRQSHQTIMSDHYDGAYMVLSEPGKKIEERLLPKFTGHDDVWMLSCALNEKLESADEALLQKYGIVVTYSS
jgi:hypothetical protein